MTDAAAQPIVLKKPFNAGAFLSRHVAVFNVLGLLAVLAGCALYIVQINSSVTTGYALRDLQTKVDQLTLDNQHLEVSVRKTQSLEAVENSVKILGMVPSDAPSYVTAGAPSFALAK